MTEKKGNMRKTINKIVEDNKEEINACLSKILENKPDEANRRVGKGKKAAGQRIVPKTLMGAVGALPASSVIGMDSKKRLIVSNRKLADI